MPRRRRSAQFCPGVSPWVFDDVLASDPFCGFITKIANQGVTLGCLVIDGNHRLFCPGDAVRRDQMAAFLARLSDALFPLTCASGQVLKWNGSAWAVRQRQQRWQRNGDERDGGHGPWRQPEPDHGLGIDQHCDRVSTAAGLHEWTDPEEQRQRRLDVRGGCGRRRDGDEPHARIGDHADAEPDHDDGEHCGGHDVPAAASIEHVCGRLIDPRDRSGRDGDVPNRQRRASKRLRQSGNAFGANAILGTTDAFDLDIRVNNSRVMRYQANAISPNVIGGSPANSAAVGVRGATMAGGGVFAGDTDPDFGDEFPNQVTDAMAPSGEAYDNRAGNDAGQRRSIARSPRWAAAAATPRAVVRALSEAAPGTLRAVRTPPSPEALRTSRPALSSTVGGGGGNQATGGNSTIGGGTGNAATSTSSAIAGGSDNQATGSYATIGGGAMNVAGQKATVGGGDFNSASGTESTVGGGFFQHCDRFSQSTVGGGQANDATGIASTVIGGFSNTAAGDYSVAMGRAPSRRTATGRFRSPTAATSISTPTLPIRSVFAPRAACVS